jgi:hypothetical protein
MREVDRQPAHGDTHPPAHDEAERAESRQETVERVLAESRQDQVEAGQGSVPQADPSTRRGFNRVVRARAALGFLGGFALGALVIVIGKVTMPEALNDPTAGPLTAAIVVTGLLTGIIVAIITAFVTLEREDGRIEREVEKDVGAPQPAPADPIDPQHDVKSPESP